MRIIFYVINTTNTNLTFVMLCNIKYINIYIGAQTHLGRANLLP